MKRRHAISFAVGGAAIAGCRPQRHETTPVAAPPEQRVDPGSLEGFSLTPVNVDASLEIRTVCGLRPFRPSGFVVRRDERGDKSVIHNYGHGGGGISLSWGCAHLATLLAGPLAGRTCAVVGGGVMGLSTARMLQLHGAEVTLYTRELPPETTSNIAGAQWWPVSVFSPGERTESFGRQFVEAANFSHRYFQDLVGARWGIRWIPNYYLSENAPADGWMSGPGGVLHHLQIGFRDFGPGEHIFPARHVRRFHSLLIEPATYLSTLLRDVQGAGAKIVIREFRNADELLQTPAKTVFNCSGLGSRELFGDEELNPIKGQLSVLLPQPEVAYNLISDLYYMFPRSDGIVLGGTYERGTWDLAPDPAARGRVLDTHRALFAQMAANQQAVR